MLIYLCESQSYREKRQKSSIRWFSPQMATRAKPGTDRSRVHEIRPRLPRGCQGPRHSSHLLLCVFSRHTSKKQDQKQNSQSRFEPVPLTLDAGSRVAAYPAALPLGLLELLKEISCLNWMLRTCWGSLPGREWSWALPAQ